MDLIFTFIGLGSGVGGSGVEEREHLVLLGVDRGGEAGDLGDVDGDGHS
jgi:hypothetical protein